MTARSNFRANTVGSKARRLLAGDPEAAVWGTTSRGVFIRLGSGWIIYLSPEAFPGPLTLNLERSADQIYRLNKGDVVRITKHCLDFPRTGIQINLQHAATWDAPPSPKAPVNLEQCRLRLQETGNLAGRTPGSLFQSYLALSYPAEQASLPEDRWKELLSGLLEARVDKAAERIAVCLDEFLGRGSGLTPSGDDLVLGFLLALNRWGEPMVLEIEAEVISQIVVSAAYTRTTTLSANLIQCAAEGQANQRLILSLDGIMTGTPDTRQCAALLADWGNTSGLDALAGMGVAIG